MTEKKRTLKAGQENLEADQGPKGLPEQTPVSAPDSGVLPPLLSLGKLDRKIERYLWVDLEQVGLRLPGKLVSDFRLHCENTGYHRQYGQVIGCLVALWLGGQLQCELSNPPSKGRLGSQLEEREIRNILQDLDNTRRRRGASWLIQELQGKLAKAAKKVKLPMELEQQVRKELNL